ncbi:hypothetical protein L202_06789 [Cryptococcus amylolentus CBS 6039]|uniref:ferric-chelate reductase (NADPH) n=1 Tax=Cryptococcus amylolentus CBS 6039 TaxID=1295533 RepID=A0A1E3HDE9_9TREE|nr:hypothetical protein L202_06789 [Cryptococcus amylolentus CBS 6039]ODN74378.1 hypothetical protein L202_06789 [Cryptococcus amylolentus CBS 6039]
MPTLLTSISPLNSTSPLPSNTTQNSTQNSTTPAPTGHILFTPRYHYYASRYSWLWILSAISFLVMLHLLRLLRHHHRRQRQRQSLRREVRGYKAVAGDEDDRHASDPSSSPASGNGMRKRAGWATRQLRAIGAGWRNVMYLSRFPSWLYMPETVADAVWTLLYMGVYLFFGFHKTSSWFPMRNDNVANQFGVMSFSQLPLILLLVSKNNPISSLTGITYQKLNYLHRASSRLCLLTSWVHALLWTPRVWAAGDTRPYLLFGIAALTGFTMLWITSFRIIRRVAYEFFLVAHILFSIMYLVGALFHWKWLHYWVWPALLIWGVDRAIRFGRFVYINGGGRGRCQVELLDHDVMRITINRRNWSWKAGQHAFISAPSISLSPHESHPFSIANVPTPSSNDAIFLIRIHSGFTKRLRLALGGDVERGVRMYVEGPYGYAHSLDGYEAVLLLAGGTGVTFGSGHMLQILQNAKEGGSAVKHLHLVWHIRHPEDIEWLAPLLNLAASLSAQSEIELRVDVYVTKSHASDEPLPPNGISERLAAMAPDYLRERFDEARIPLTPFGAEPGTPGTMGGGESRDETILLPKPLPPMMSGTREMGRVGRFGLTGEAASLVKWHRGRADLGSIVEEDARACEGAMNVSACGPVQLLQSAKKAVKEVSTMRATRDGLASIDFFEETLGA